MKINKIMEENGYVPKSLYDEQCIVSYEMTKAAAIASLVAIASTTSAIYLLIGNIKEKKRQKQIQKNLQEMQKDISDIFDEDEDDKE